MTKQEIVNHISPMQYTDTKRFKKLTVEYLKNDDAMYKEKEIEKIYFTTHEVMMETGLSYFHLMKMVHEKSIKPMVRRRGFVRFQ